MRMPDDRKQPEAVIAAILRMPRSLPMFPLEVRGKAGTQPVGQPILGRDNRAGNESDAVDVQANTHLGKRCWADSREAIPSMAASAE
jgi:hypothetical protein